MLVLIIYTAHVQQNRATINPCTKQKGSVKWKLWTDCGPLFLGLENNGTIVVMFLFAW